LLGLSLSFGVLLAVNLRILGVMKRIPFTEVHRLLPWGMLGFGANLITGMFFFVGQPAQYIASPPFFWKIIFLVIAGANFLYLTVLDKPWRRSEGGDDRFDANLADKAMAVSSIAAWLAVLYAGRMLPFLGKSF
jgi:energy-coupling factor transporter transmembrane protein EcfT